MKNRTPPAYLRARLADRGGFVILWAIFGFVVMVSLATLAMRVAGSERLAANAAIESTRSFYAAETGLRKTLAELEENLAVRAIISTCFWVCFFVDIGVILKSALHG